ncbi:hypothetical protein POM88_011401 [Heracleum sosnowskyi]|uniref:F-box protein n=1 Tax=Heracleum sosnowskyi TaxID=360622 RepID=A0AAD8IUV4_9APIA|nr:hypothetical protein POM88_011401 [Heracleum sosnowskyi]
MQRIMENNIVRKEPDMIRVASWSELCSDLLGDIIGRLCFTDQVYVQAVCKSWHNVYLIHKYHAVCKSLGLQSTSGFVRVFRKNQGLACTLQFHLYALSHSIDDPISVHSISLSELGVPTLSSWSDIRTFCKNNWLFISITERKNCPFAHMYFILFSPTSKKLKQLPPCLNSSAWCIEQTFSSDPESADCVFLILDTSTFHDKFVVATCRKDDNKWNVRCFSKIDTFQRCVCMPMYARGNFYIVSPDGQLASYNVTENIIEFECLSTYADLADNYTSSQTCILFMVNGEVMCNFGHKANPRTERYDRSKKVWIPVSSLRDSAILNIDKTHSVQGVKNRFEVPRKPQDIEVQDMDIMGQMQGPLRWFRVPGQVQSLEVQVGSIEGRGIALVEGLQGLAKPVGWNTRNQYGTHIDYSDILYLHEDL